MHEHAAVESAVQLLLFQALLTIQTEKICLCNYQIEGKIIAFLCTQGNAEDKINKRWELL